MSTIGYLQIYAFASNARLPLRDAAVSIIGNDGRIIAMGLTDKNGKFGPIEITVPDRQESLTPGSIDHPFTTVDIHSRLENYEQIEANKVQIFANTVTVQNLEMIPLSELPQQWTKSETFNTPAQNL